MKKHLITFLICLLGVQACLGEECLPTYSTANKSACTINRREQQGVFRYTVRRIDLEKDKLQMHEKSFESPVLYTAGFICDQAVALSNNDCHTNAKATIAVWNVESNTVSEDMLHLQMDSPYMGAYRLSSIIHFADHAEQATRVRWHQNEWTHGENVLYLRLGGLIPNACAILWTYDLKTNQSSFTMTKGGKTMIIPHTLTEKK